MAEFVVGSNHRVPAIFDNPQINNKDEVINANGTYTPPTGYSGFGTVTVQVPNQSVNQDKTFTTNGTYTPDIEYTGFGTVTVAVPNGTETINITENGTYTPTSPNIGFSQVTVAVPNGTETINITENGTYTPTSPNIGFSSVTVAVPNGTETKSVTANGTYTPTSPNVGFSQVDVNVPLVINNEDKTITDNGTYTASSGYDGLGTVTVNVTQDNVSKFGVTIDNVVGNITNGTLGAPTSVNGMAFTGVTDMSAGALSSWGFGINSITGHIDFPNLVSITGDSAMSYAFYSKGISSVSFPSLTSITGDNALFRAFYTCSSLTSISFPELASLTGNSCLREAFYGSKVSSVSFPKLTTVDTGFYHTFENSSNLESVEFPMLTSIGNSGFNGAFQGCRKLTTVSFPSLVNVTSGATFNMAFYNCTSLTSVLFPNLKTIGGNNSSGGGNHFGSAFYNCSKVTLSFPELEAIYCTGSNTTRGTFSNNTNSMTSVYFPKLSKITYGSGASSSNQNACKYIFYNCTNLSEIHFGAANETAIKATSGYSTKWGAPSTATIYFDL